MMSIRMPSSRKLSNESRMAGRSHRSMRSCPVTSKPERPQLRAYVGEQTAPDLACAIGALAGGEAGLDLVAECVITAGPGAGRAVQAGMEARSRYRLRRTLGSFEKSVAAFKMSRSVLSFGGTSWRTARSPAVQVSSAHGQEKPAPDRLRTPSLTSAARSP